MGLKLKHLRVVVTRLEAKQGYFVIQTVLEISSRLPLCLFLFNIEKRRDDELGIPQRFLAIFNYLWS